MRVTFYKSAFCPRCWAAERKLRKLAAGRPAMEIEVVDLLKERQKAREQGVRMIPALHAGTNRLSGFWLSEDRIRRFLDGLS